MNTSVVHATGVERAPYRSPLPRLAWHLFDRGWTWDQVAAWTAAVANSTRLLPEGMVTP